MSLKFNFLPLVSVDADANTVGVGFNIADVPGFAPFGTALTYKQALGATYTGLTDGTTYYAVTDPHDPQNLYLTTGSADAGLAYAAGLSAYATSYQNDVNTHVTAGDTQSQATAAADTDAATQGASWFTDGHH